MKNTIYIGYKFTVEPKEPATEILIAELGNINFESFVENEKGVTAYIKKEDWSSSILEDIYILKSNEFSIDYNYKEIVQTNWNEEWEKNFKPIEVEGIVSIRAPFHKNTELTYDIVIEPKMSFGTGHHETTHMMIQHLLKLSLEGKKVLDMGCGTGILAIFAEMRGAKPIDAIDIDNWCYINSLENIERNNCKYITAFEGDVSLLKDQKYDVIIANINRNVLINHMKTYISCLNDNGVLLLSGFYEEDMQIIDKEVFKYGLQKDLKIVKNRWTSVKYKK